MQCQHVGVLVKVIWKIGKIIWLHREQLIKMWKTLAEVWCESMAKTTYGQKQISKKKIRRNKLRNKTVNSKSNIHHFRLLELTLVRKEKKSQSWRWKIGKFAVAKFCWKSFMLELIKLDLIFAIEVQELSRCNQLDTTLPVAF